MDNECCRHSSWSSFLSVLASIERHHIIIIMGKFLKDKDGQMVSIDGAPVLERTLERKEKDCDGCGFEKWVLGDTCFIVHKTEGGMQRLCPDCALAKGLPKKHYKKNVYATSLFDATEEPEDLTIALLNPLDLIACFCHFWSFPHYCGRERSFHGGAAWISVDFPCSESSFAVVIKKDSCISR